MTQSGRARTSGLRDVWSALTARERLMVAGMIVALLGFVLWFGVVAPLMAWRRDSIERHADAAWTLTSVRAAVAPAGASGDVASAQARVAELAGTHGLQAEIRSGSGVVDIRVATAAANTLFAWLAALEADRLLVRSLTVLENSDATLQAEVTVAPGM